MERQVHASALPALALGGVVTVAVVAAGWLAAPGLRLPVDTLFPFLLLGFVLFAGRPRWLVRPGGRQRRG